MAVQRLNQTSFAAGILGRRLRGRTDLAQYAAGAEDLTNVRVLTGGAATRRPGSYYVAAPAGPCRLVPFRVSSEVAYVLEFSDGLLRFFRNRAPLLDSFNNAIELATEYAAADLAALRFAQSADVLYIFHPSWPTAKLSRTSANLFSKAPVDFVNGPYDRENFGDIGGTPSAPEVSAAEVSAPPPAPGGTGTTPGPDPSVGSPADAGAGNPGFNGELEGGGGEPGAGGEIGLGGTTGLEG
jgi:hypothetical protein